MKAWLQASRLASQVYIFVPILVGQLLATGGFQAMNWWAFFFAHLVGLFDQLFIVYSNDFYDFETDSRNENFNIFSGGSRVLVEGQLAPNSLRKAYQLMAALTVLSSLPLIWLSDAIWSPVLAGIGLALMAIYSFPPIQLSYRGGGELLQVVGVAVLLPVFGYYAQAGNLQVFPWQLLLVLIPSQLSCAISTSIMDVKSDRASRKRTLSVLLGARRVRPLIILLQCLAIYQLGIQTGIGRLFSSAYFFVLLLMVSVTFWPIATKRKPLVYVGLNIFLTTCLTLSTLLIALG